jgi:hypothetical protein
MKEKAVKQTVLFLSDKSSEWIVENYNQIKKTTSVNYDVIFLYHQKSDLIPETIRSLNYFGFTNNILSELKYQPIENSLVPGSNHFPLLKFYLENPKYDYYWNIEDDVCFQGNWNHLFDAYKNCDADFISSNISNYHELPNWYWWFTLNSNKENISIENKIKSFNPIYRISNRALALLHQELQTGWSGHHEVVIPTLLHNNGFKIIDMGGTGSFVPVGYENRFYTNESMSHLPVEMGNEENRIYHPIKEKKEIDLDKLKKYCVISAVGKNSLHREWIKESPDFDLHLIIYDNAYNKFYNDTNFIAYQKGYKFELVYNYLAKNPVYLEKYEYFFIPDDDIQIDAANIAKLFEYMKTYNLSIAQPGLTDSYYTYEHTMKCKSTLLRYSNFVEMMTPCFSQDALKKILYTFNENKSGWGTEFHWPELIGFSGTEMAIVDDIEAVHTRPIQSFNQQNMKELTDYIEKYKLSREINEYGNIPNENYKPTESNDWKPIVTDNSLYGFIQNQLKIIGNSLLSNIDSTENLGLLEGRTGVSLFFLNYYRLTGKRKFLDYSIAIIESVCNILGALRDNSGFSDGLSGISWYIEYLAQHEYIENDTDELLEEICNYLNEINFNQLTQIGIRNGLIGYGMHFQARMSNPNFSPQKELNARERNMNNIIIGFLDDHLDKLKHENCINPQNEHEISEIILFLYKTLKINPQNKILIQISNGYISYFQEYLEKKDSSITNAKTEELIATLNCDLQNAYALFQVAKILNNEEKESFSLKMALETIKQKNSENSNTGILTGTMGIAHLYNHFYQQTSVEVFKTAALYWISETYKQKTMQSEIDVSLLDGLTGMGLVLISAMADFKPDWDSCLLL